LKPSPRSIGPAAPYPTGGHIPGIPPPAKFATEPQIAVVEEGGLTNVLAADERVERAAVRTDIERAQATTKK
jgi:hypothetical protein